MIFGSFFGFQLSAAKSVKLVPPAVAAPPDRTTSIPAV
jgi:hypothetical protein